MDGCPLGLGLVVEDKPTKFSCDKRASKYLLQVALPFACFT